MSLAPARRRLVLSAVVAALAVSALVAMVVARTTGDRVTPVAQGQQGPVLLVSGYGGSTGSLEPVRAALEETGRDVIVVPPVGGGTGDLEVQARSLGNAAAAARARSGAPSVDVVGYSAGGVVARSWVRDHGGASVAGRVLSIGSPQHGTSAATCCAGSTPVTRPLAGRGPRGAGRPADDAGDRPPDDAHRRVVLTVRR